jgi:hypothetical protein
VQGLEIVPGHSAFDATTPKTVSAHCPTGKKLTGGGAKIIFGPGAAGQVMLTESAPLETFNGQENVISDDTWRARADSIQPAGGAIANWQLQVFVVCVNA